MVQHLKKTVKGNWKFNLICYFSITLKINLMALQRNKKWFYNERKKKLKKKAKVVFTKQPVLGLLLVSKLKKTKMASISTYEAIFWLVHHFLSLLISLM